MADRRVTIVISAKDDYSVTLSRYQQNLEKSEKASRELGKSSDQLGGAIRGMVTAAALYKGLEFAGEMYELGTSANAVEERFNALVGAFSNTDETMRKLRAATLGIVDDQTLQAASARLVQLANIDNADALAHVLELVVKTKQPTESLSEATEKYARLLSSGSVQLLDNYGLSLSDVREETERLMNANLELSRTEARTQAIINLSEQNVTDLGEAADVASTSIARLGNVLENEKQNVAQTFSRSIENLGQGIEKLFGIHPDQLTEAQRRAAEYAEAMANDVVPIMDEIFSRQADSFDPSFMGSFITRAIMAAENDPALASNTARLADKVLSDMSFAGETSPFDKYNFSTGLPNREYRDLAGDVVELLALQDQERDNAQAIADAEAERLANNEAVADAQRDINQLGQHAAEIFMNVGDAVLNMGFDLAAEQAAKLREELDGMSLNEMFGVTDGSRLGEITDLITESMSQLGKSVEAITSFQTGMDNLSGRNTASEQLIQNVIVPTIANIADVDPTTANMMATSLNNIMNEAFLAGIDINTPQFISALSAQFDSSDFTVIDPQLFLDSLDPAVEIAGSMATTASDSEIAAENMANMEVHLGGAVTHSDKLKTNLDDISGKEYKIKISPEFTNIPAMAQMLWPDLFRMFTQAVQGAGGIAPGTDTRASQSGSMVRMGQSG